jgi:hypothetical protein
MTHEQPIFGRRAAIRRRADQARARARQVAGESATAALCFAGMATIAGLADRPGAGLVAFLGATLATIVGLAAVAEA